MNRGIGLGMVRRVGKRIAENLLVGSGADRLGRWMRRERGVVLAYHNIVPDTAPETGESSLHLRVSEFARQLEMLECVGRVISLEDLLFGEKSGPDGMAFAVTFDDGYRGAVTLGIRELGRRGLPGTIFVAPALLQDRTFWWDALGSATGELRQRILQEGQGTHEGARRVARECGVEMRTVPALWRSITEAELQEALRVDGVTVASHSWSHPSLIRLTENQLEEEVSRPRKWLRGRFGSQYVDVLSYPYGLHSASVRNAARNAHYRAGLALTPGSIGMADAPQKAFRLPRLNVPAGLSLSGLRVRAAWC